MATLGDVLDQAAELEASGALADAERLYHHILDTIPDHPASLNGLAGLALKVGRLDLAIDFLRRAVAAAPAEAVLHRNLAMMLWQHGEKTEAVSRLSHAITMPPAANPEWVAVLGGWLLEDPARQSEAIALLERAVEMGCTDLYLFNALAGVHSEAGRFPQSVAAYRQALRHHPDAAHVFSNMLVTIAFMGAFSPRQVFEEHRRFGETYEPRFAVHRRRPHLNDPDPERPLRIGYLSPQFCGHILMMNMLPLLREHDRSTMSVHVFAHVPQPDQVTRRIMGMCDEFHFINELDDDQAAELVRQCRIDILVHPMGHWADNRLLVCARKPAPIQVNYTCNSPTTGMTSFDYMFVDRWLDHDGRMQQYAVETLYPLESGFLTTEYSVAPEIGPPPFRARGRVTFGCFNNPAKLSDETLALWSRVLAAVPESELLIKGGKIDLPGFAESLRERFRRQGGDPSRLRLMGHVNSYQEHLLAHNQVDIFLDPLPFGGGRTTEDAIWMGCPVITLVGDGLHSRNTSNRHHRIGTPELCSHSQDEYVAIAAALAADGDRIAFYRSNLRDMMQRSSLMNFRAHAADLERAYRDMWRRWCRDQSANA